jgi:hypothetical protein
MKTVMLWLLVTLALVACDRRREYPSPDESDTTDTVVADPAQAPPSDSSDPLPPPATSACAGLTGEAEADCLERERAGSEPAPTGDPEDDSTPP